MIDSGEFQRSPTLKSEEPANNQVTSGGRRQPSGGVPRLVPHSGTRAPEPGVAVAKGQTMVNLTCNG